MTGAGRVFAGPAYFGYSGMFSVLAGRAGSIIRFAEREACHGMIRKAVDPALSNIGGCLRRPIAEVNLAEGGVALRARLGDPAGRMRHEVNPSAATVEGIQCVDRGGISGMVCEIGLLRLQKLLKRVAKWGH